MISEARKEALRVSWMRSKAERPWRQRGGEIFDAGGRAIGTMTISQADAQLAIDAVNVLPLVTLPPEAERETDGGRVAELAATIAAGIEAGLQASPAVESVSGGPSWGSAEEVARRAVAIARAILAEVREP